MYHFVYIPSNDAYNVVRSSSKKRRFFFAFNMISQLNDKFQCNNNDNVKIYYNIFGISIYNDVESQLHTLDGIIIHRRI